MDRLSYLWRAAAINLTAGAAIAWAAGTPGAVQAVGFALTATALSLVPLLMVRRMAKLGPWGEAVAACGVTLAWILGAAALVG